MSDHWLLTACPPPTRWSLLPQLVFHGTPERNIQSICRQGLDPKRRAGQAYGPGEYFGGVSASPQRVN